MSDAGEMVPSRRLRRSPAPEIPFEDEDLLGECLIRLPPRPSLLARACLVCKRWHGLVSDPQFPAPLLWSLLLGYFSFDSAKCRIAFTSALDSPDRIPAEQPLIPKRLN
ncbi:hypothetical protein PR202_ga20923 [Eleusine coracana subsp. coracana]|uniref:F-box domain-containing protein n=1 Tax=Eleusine coracana subsp. coracana TaxID=191504 RepID=A0AAV5D008_ELECO|nr:hypothetical protein PR202_ga20923 [Eleusine coracana subsp. coracana]